MSFTPLLAIVALLAIGAAVTLTILFRASQAGMFRNLKAGAYVIFDEDEPVGEPQDQLFNRDPEPDPGSDDPSSSGKTSRSGTSGDASAQAPERGSRPDAGSGAIDAERDGTP